MTSSFDVTAFGAVGDGKTDDTAAVAKAVAAAAAAPPSTVLFPGGKVFLTGPLNMSSGMTLRVDGVIRAKSGNNTADGISEWPQVRVSSIAWFPSLSVNIPTNHHTCRHIARVNPV